MISFAYVQAYANEALWLQLGAPGSEVPLERVEAEATTVLTRNRSFLFHQAMDGFGGIMWSGKTQLFCRAEADAFVELSFDVRNAGRYRVRFLGTAAPDFGTIRVALDGKACESDFDLYSGRVSPSGSLELGIHQMAVGRHTVRVTSVGKNSASSNVHFGLDAIDLLATE